MSNLSKRSTVYFEPEIHRTLRLKAACSDISISELIDETVRLMMRVDQEDLAVFDQHENEKDISYEDLLRDLRKYGKI